MNKSISDKKNAINADMAVLDIVSRYRQTQDVFKRYDEKASECICCRALFDSLRDVAERYGLDLRKLLADLEHAANST